MLERYVSQSIRQTEWPKMQRSVSKNVSDFKLSKTVLKFNFTSLRKKYSNNGLNIYFSLLIVIVKIFFTWHLKMQNLAKKIEEKGGEKTKNQNKICISQNQKKLK